MSRHPTARAGTKMLGRYRIERELGRGGMGVVYVATDENTGRLVALKTTMVAGLGSGEKTRNQRRERFVREVRALTQVNHENVVHVFDAGECDDPDLGWLLFYTMEYVEGTTLAALVQEQGALNGGEAAAIVMHVAAGLGEAHSQGIIHRDVKPANIFLSVDGHAKIGDFGIAKIEGSTQITRRDQLVGTPNYLAPEQILGDAVGPATDVFALGALFYVITQNRPLRQQVDAAALLASANGDEPVQRMQAVQNLSEGLRRVIARALERDPTRRYRDGVALADALVEHATRVPVLKGSPERARFLNEGTSDRSSAFINTNPEGDAGDAGGANSVEAMAAAMLGEVERRSSGMFKQPPVTAAAELPVARTESTVMFNLRAMEEERRGPALPSVLLPVARTESTAIFRMTEQSPEPVKQRIELEPIAEEAMAPTKPPAKDEWEETTHESAALPGRPRAEMVAQAASLAPKLEAWRAKLPRRWVLVALCFGVGGLLGLLLAIALAPSSPSAKPLTPPGDELDVAPLQSRPALCPDRSVGAQEQAEAAAFLDDARALKRDGVSSSKIRDSLRLGIEKDPTNHLLFYELGRLSTGSEQDDADECVCQIAAGSKECGIVEKSRGR